MTSEAQAAHPSAACKPKVQIGDDNRPYSVQDIIDLFQKATFSGNTSVLSANSYYNNIKADIEYAISKDPTAAPRMAKDALECAILGMRRVMRGVRPPRLGLVARIFFGKGTVGRTHPSFDNDAFSLFMTVLFDAMHNLPAIAMPGDRTSYTVCEPAKEIAMTLACLRLLAVTTAAVDSRFESYFMSRTSTAAQSSTKDGLPE